MINILAKKLDYVENYNSDTDYIDVLDKLYKTNKDLHRQISNVLNYDKLPRYEYDNFRGQLVEYSNGSFEEHQSSIGLPEEDFFKDQYEKDINRYFYSKLSQLKPKEQQVILLHEIQQKSFKVMSQEINEPISTLSSRYKTAMQNLRNLINIKVDREMFYDLSKAPQGYSRNVHTPMSTPFDYSSQQYPCTTLKYFEQSFGDTKTVCPGNFNDDEGMYLGCTKRFTVHIKDPQKITGEVSTEEAMDLLGVSKSTLDKLCNSGQIKYQNVKYGKTRRRKINLSLIQDCGEKIFDLGF